MEHTHLIDQAYELLGKRRVLLQIHDPSFPAADEDIGCGTPYGRAGDAFVRFARSLGFNGIQLGPQGRTTRDNPSPYDSTVFSRSLLSISFPELSRDPIWSYVVDQVELESALSQVALDRRCRYEAAFDSQTRLCKRAYERYKSGRLPGKPFVARFVTRFMKENHDWLESDAIHEALSRHYGTPDWSHWEGDSAAVDRQLFCPPEQLEEAARRRLAQIRRQYRSDIECYGLIQYLAHRQHRRFHERAEDLDLMLYADLQVGLAWCDQWRLQPLFLPRYLLGAPPSRTNGNGQPWGYPVLDPDRYHAGGAGPGCSSEAGGVAYLRARAEKLFEEFDGVRVDHPQGLVCPWIYPADDTDPLRAVQNGARLFSSPDRPDLAKYAIARADQIARGSEAVASRHADGWVRRLDPQQADRYATLISVIVEAARDRGLEPQSIACETLSTQPYPLRLVTERFGLGRFRVTQKMDVNDPRNVYRTDNAATADWIMMSTHDTPSVWEAVREWERDGTIGDRASYLARRLVRNDETDSMRRALCSDQGMLVHAHYADLLVSDAENVSVFFPDLLGMEERYNLPGSVGPHNWSLRVPADYRDRYADDRAKLRALNIPHACAMALRSPAVSRGQIASRIRLAYRLERIGLGLGTSATA